MRDSSKSFPINQAGNSRRCFSESSNVNNGGKRGECYINFVALMDGLGQLEAAKKLAGWFGIGETAAPAKPQTETAEPLAQQSSEAQKQSPIEIGTASSANVKCM
jgi:hypothetical protein